MKKIAPPGCPGLVAPLGEEVGRVRPFRVRRLWFHRTGGWSMVRVGLIVRAATIGASSVDGLEVMRLSIGVAVRWHSVAEQT